MEDVLGILLVALSSYLLGSISFATIFSKKFKNIDPRDFGSRNAGATNVFRTAGVLPAVLTLVFDILKGVIAVLVALFLAKWTEMDYGFVLPQIAAVLVVIGHMYPIYYKFKGGKGMATGLGVIMILNWHIGIIVLAFALTVMIVSRYVSLGSIAGAMLFFVLTIFFADSYIMDAPLFSHMITSFIISFFMIYKHKDNIQRLKIGEENKISFKKK